MSTVTQLSDGKGVLYVQERLPKLQAARARCGSLRCPRRAPTLKFKRI